MNRTIRLKYTFLFILLPVLAVFIFYQPAISGPFLFDDFPNLSPIGQLGGVNSFESLKAYLASGFSGPTGRPVSLLSFLLDDNGWPSSPERFKSTNLMLHLVCGLMLMGIFYRTCRYRFQDSKAIYLSIFAAVAWLAHPLWVSTVMYVVQRMTILSALFSLLAIWSYLLIRPRFELYPVKSFIVASFFVGIFALLSIFSKENGALVFFYIVLIEYLIISPVKPIKNKWFVYWRHICLTLPIAAISGYLIYVGVKGWDVVWDHRNFNLPERLLTESRVLWLYLNELIIPRSSTSGLYTDYLQVSKSLYQPITTLFSILALIGTVVLSIIFRRKWPFLCLAILFFFSGHLIESTVIGLELYFEHRNYMPSMFLFLALSVGISLLSIPNKSKVLIAGCILSLCLAMLWMRAGLWSSEKVLFKVWAHNAPESERAQLQASLMASQQGDYVVASQYIEKAMLMHPEAVNPLLARLYLDCSFRVTPNILPQSFYEKTIRSLETQKFHISSYKYLEQLVYKSSNHSCVQLNYSILHELLEAFLSNRYAQSGSRQGMILFLQGLVSMNENFYGEAYEYFNRSFGSWMSIDPAMLSVARLATEEQYEFALMLLNTVELNYRESSLRATRNYNNDIEHLRHAIKKAMSERTQ